PLAVSLLTFWPCANTPTADGIATAPAAASAFRSSRRSRRVDIITESPSMLLKSKHQHRWFAVCRENAVFQTSRHRDPLFAARLIRDHAASRGLASGDLVHQLSVRSIECEQITVEVHTH